jgi:hypothetical protein
MSLRSNAILGAAAVALMTFNSRVYSQELTTTYRSNSSAQWRNYSGALIPWAYWAKPREKAWRNIFVSYANGSASRMSVLVECSSKKLAINSGPLGNLRFVQTLQWSQHSLATGWGQIIQDLCISSPPAPVSSAIDNIPVVATRNLAEAPFRISGRLIYPSDYMPGQKICALSITGLEQRCTKTSDGETKYSIFVPAGDYVVYSETSGEKTWATNAISCSGSASGQRSTPDSGAAYWEELVKVTVFHVRGDISDVCPVDYYTWEHQLEFPIPVVATDLQGISTHFTSNLESGLRAYLRVAAPWHGIRHRSRRLRACCCFLKPKRYHPLNSSHYNLPPQLSAYLQQLARQSSHPLPLLPSGVQLVRPCSRRAPFSPGSSPESSAHQNGAPLSGPCPQPPTRPWASPDNPPRPGPRRALVAVVPTAAAAGH